MPKFDLLKVEQDFPKKFQWMVVGYVEPREEDWRLFERMATIEFMKKHGKVLTLEILEKNDEKYYEEMYRHFLMINDDSLREMYHARYPERSSLVRMWKVYKLCDDKKVAEELAKEYQGRDGCDFTVSIGGAWNAFNPPSWLCQKTDYCNDKMNQLMMARQKQTIDFKKHKAERARLLLEKTIVESEGRSKHRNDSLNHEAMEHRRLSDKTFAEEFKYFDQNTINSLKINDSGSEEMRKDLAELKDIEDKLHQLEQSASDTPVEPLFIAKQL